MSNTTAVEKKESTWNVKYFQQWPKYNTKEVIKRSNRLFSCPTWIKIDDRFGAHFIEPTVNLRFISMVYRKRGGVERWLMNTLNLVLHDNKEMRFNPIEHVMWIPDNDLYAYAFACYLNVIDNVVGFDRDEVEQLMKEYYEKVEEENKEEAQAR